MIQDLSLALTEYENNAELRCAVIFAHGDHFTAGLDLVELQSTNTILAKVIFQKALAPRVSFITNSPMP